MPPPFDTVTCNTMASTQMACPKIGLHFLHLLLIVWVDQRSRYANKTDVAQEVLFPK